MNPLTDAKLWKNPLGFSFRLNHTALHFNVPVYNWIEKKYGLTRPQFVVLSSLHLRDDSTAQDICISSGFPKNTISRAVLRTIALKLVTSRVDPDDNRRLLLQLTRAGRAIVDEAIPVLIRKEDELLSTLTREERRQLEYLLERVIIGQIDQGATAVASPAEPARSRPASAQKLRNTA